MLLYAKRWILVLLFLLSMPCYAANIDKIIVFGDSLSDNGNFYSATYHIVPKSPPYFKGRFSNGPTWVEHLAAKLEVPLLNYAYGGAVAQPDKNDIDWQVNAYLKTAKTDLEKAQHLYVVWIGSNDYLPGRGDIEDETNKTIASIQKHIDMLVAAGAKKLLVINLPDLSKTPLVKLVNHAYAVKVSNMVKLHNAKLRLLLKKERTKYPEVRFIAYDISHYFSDALLHPSKYGVSNTQDACYESDTFMFSVLSDTHYALSDEELRKRDAIVQCVDADQHLFWDHVHPSRVTHWKIATAIYARVRGL